MKNKTQAINAIKKDCKIQAVYYNQGKTCAIGCLALLAGVSAERLKEAHRARICHEDLADIKSKITKRFGLRLTTLEIIQGINDDTDLNLAERRIKIVKLFKTK